MTMYTPPRHTCTKDQLQVMYMYGIDQNTCVNMFTSPTTGCAPYAPLVHVGVWYVCVWCGVCVWSGVCGVVVRGVCVDVCVWMHYGVRVYMYVCMSGHTNYISVCVGVHICMCGCTYLYVWVYISVCVGVHICMCGCTYLYVWVYISVCVGVHICMCGCTYLYVWVYISVCVLLPASLLALKRAGCTPKCYSACPK